MQGPPAGQDSANDVPALILLTFLNLVFDMEGFRVAAASGGSEFEKSIPFCRFPPWFKNWALQAGDSVAKPFSFI